LALSSIQTGHLVASLRSQEIETMNTAILNAIAILTVTGSVACGQLFPPRPGDLTASIPFAFEVNGKRMQAGEYVVRADAERGVLYVCEDGVYCAETEIESLNADRTAGELQLVFTKHRGRYRLSVVLCERGRCFELPLIASVAVDDRIERVKARKLVIHDFKGLPVSWS
jgi:hypothetical protein